MSNTNNTSINKLKYYSNESVWLTAITDRPANRAACQHCSYSVVPKWFFLPHRGDTLLRFMSRLSGQKCANTAPKIVQTTSLHNFYEIFSICTRRQVVFEFLIGLLSGVKQPSYKHLPCSRVLFLKGKFLRKIRNFCNCQLFKPTFLFL